MVLSKFAARAIVTPVAIQPDSQFSSGALGGKPPRFQYFPDVAVSHGSGVLQ
jgi:hypothetical protein